MSNQNAMYGFGLSVAVASMFTALLVVAKEMNAPLLSWMNATSGHHWVTHGILTLAVFVALGLILTRLGSDERSWLNANRLTFVLAASIVVSGAIIFGFFLAHL